MSPRLICIIGTDGSGKPSLANAVVAALTTRGTPARKVWLGAESYLMAPIRALLRRVWTARGKPQVANACPHRVDYTAEIARKNALAAKHPIAVQIYLALVWADYRLQLALKRLSVRRADILVADRYLFDVAVNIGLTLGWTPDQVVRCVSTKLAFLPLPEVRVFLAVPPEVSLARKDDIPDITYLRLRFAYYQAIAQAFGFAVRDGTLPIATNRDWLLAAMHTEATRPFVLYVHSNNSDIGGADKVLALMAEHMADRSRPSGGARVAVALRLQTAIVDSYARAGIPVIHHPFVRPQLSKGAIGLIRFALTAPASLWFFWRLIGRTRPDIVHVNDLYDFLPAAAARLRGVPLVWHIRMIPTQRVQRAAFARMVATLATVSISVSRAVRDTLFATPPAGHRALVIHDLGNARLIADDRNPKICAARPQGLPQSGRLVLMVGRIEPWKGQDIFIEAIRLLPETLRHSACFALVGGGVEAKEAYLARIRREADHAGIVSLGTRDDVPALLRAADISVHASVLPDPFPGVVIESMLAGAATIAARAGGTIEMIDDTVSGRLTPPGDAAALAAALSDMLTNATSPRARFGPAARARALALVDAQAIDSALENTYGDLLAARTSLSSAKAIPT